MGEESAPERAKKNRNIRMRGNLEVADLARVRREGVYTPHVLFKSVEVIDSAGDMGRRKCKSGELLESKRVREAFIFAKTSLFRVANPAGISTRSRWSSRDTI